jgi:hypothetical protein
MKYSESHKGVKPESFSWYHPDNLICEGEGYGNACRKPGGFYRPQASLGNEEYEY